MTSGGETIAVSVLFFARARELAGTTGATLALRAPATVGDARAALTETYPALGKYLDSCRLAVDQEFSAMDRPLEDGSELAIIPPVSGG